MILFRILLLVILRSIVAEVSGVLPTEALTITTGSIFFNMLLVILLEIFHVPNAPLDSFFTIVAT